MSTSKVKPENESIEQQLERSRLELLDMGLRGNPQLNCRSNSQKVLDIVDEKSVYIYELLVKQEARMSFLPIPKIYQKQKEADEQDRSFTFEQPEQVKLPPLDVHLAEKKGDARFSDKHLQTGLIPEKLDKSLLRIETEAHNLLQEQGIEVLYLALGFLKWYEDERSQTARYAPLVLLPVELIRTSAREGFKLRYTGEDIGPNLTLAAKLNGEYNLKLPLFNEEFEPLHYYQSVSESIEKMPRWQVMEDKVSLSLFSFGKFQMYMDLDPLSWPEGKAPSQNPLLNRLLKRGFDESEVIVKQASNHKTLQSPETLPLVKDADSSQLESVIAALNGADLIIQGPPGTGKSQTITNIIAESMGRGKKILFVAQKMAALEVVKKRLDECHLGHAVLELHSHKSTKKAVLASLAQAVEQGKPSIPDRTMSYKQLADTKESLNAYVAAIEKPILDSSISYVDALGFLQEAESQRGNTVLPELPFYIMKVWNVEEFTTATQLVQSLIDHLDHMGIPEENAFSMSDRCEISPVDQKYISETSAICHEDLDKLIQCGNALASDMGLPLPSTIHELEVINRAAARALEAPKLSGINVDTDDWQIRRETIREGLAAGCKMTKLYDSYEAQFVDQAFDAELLTIRQGLIGCTNKWWRIFSGDYRRAKKSLATLCKEPLAGNPNDWLLWVDDLLDYQKQQKFFQEHELLFSTLFGAQWQGTKSDWIVLNALSEWIIDLYEQIGKGDIPRGLAQFLSGNSDLIQHKQRFDISQTLARKLDVQLNQLAATVSIANDNPLNNLSSCTFEKLLDILSHWQDVDALYQYVRYNQLVDTLKKSNLTQLADYSQNWRQDNALLLSILKLSYYQGLVTTAYDSNEVIKRFDRLCHERLLSDFRELDSDCLGYAQERLADYIYQSLPKRHAKGEMEVLMRELGKKNRHLPIRRLLAKAGNAVQQIKPIFMMSPMSISTYLEQGALDFDLVIFDEASQVTAPDALGALMRGKQVIVVGDSKQMPPSDLFGKSVQLTDDDVEGSATAEMESILSLMEAKGVPQIMLRWHYRSRNDSLIAVSNNQFYDDRLLAFPSSGIQKEAKGLSFNHLPDTLYGEGGTSSNWGEAKAIAEAVMLHAKKTPQLSLGVVAFGIVQRELIMMEVERLRRENPEFEDFFQHHAGGDEFFIKNLENVQGDERDVIFISICYGRNAEGKINQNFGLINKAGGERRLNVLISRARLAMEVFANFTADELRVHDSSPYGIRALQVFLRYAEIGGFEQGNNTDKVEVSPFEQQLYKAVSALGYSVEQRVGRQGFHLDLAIKNPEDKEQYILAIESDGASYQNATSVRDRDRLRNSILHGLGWRQHRVWSTDWYRNSQSEIRRLKEAIEKAIEEQALIDAQLKSKETADDIVTFINSNMQASTGASIEREVFDPEDETAYVPRYRVVGDSELGLPKVDDFGAIPTGTLTNAVCILVNGESPIIPSFLIARLASAAGLARAGSRVKRQVEIAIDEAKAAQYIVVRKDAILTADNQSVSLRNWGFLPDNYRKLDNICDAELVNAVLLTVRDAYTVNEKDAIVGALSLLGFKRVTAPALERVKKLVELEIHYGSLTLENERLKIKEDLQLSNLSKASL
ncbi:hypothetical protein PSECIP111951_03248 [Pseudoalteromonas holothuriae]|uniref:DUF3320 domain-containing protein n=1 Tax=Pseudoalteromonas holothuriae TaxID=2963714 RepID=A0ABN8UPL1_9GAMM|nr:DUF3320 domain-containing protein [Pseudoalteromonas sp. CIP111951]CAH9064911.1 hypothetical protein PSECIP111951_03248 [Pseudoalteromonas sp. CIP111951]